MKNSTTLFAVVCVILLTTEACYPQWNWDPAQGLRVSPGTGYQSAYDMTSDSLGGAVLSYHEHVGGSTVFRMQRLSESGYSTWYAPNTQLDEGSFPFDGSALPLSTYHRGQGYFIAWIFDTWIGGPWKLKVQRVDSLGRLLLGENGVELSDGIIPGELIGHATEHSGASLFYFENPGLCKIQVIDSVGSLLLGPNGFTFLISLSFERFHASFPDKHGAGYITYELSHNVAGVWQHEGRIQRFKWNGSTYWDQNGISYAVGNNRRTAADMVPCGANGGIIVWQDAHTDLRAQRFDSTGAFVWNPGGVSVTADSGEQELVSYYPCMGGGVVSDENEGVFVVWQGPSRSPGRTDLDVFAQHIDKYGVPQWGQNGVVLCSATGDQLLVKGVHDGMGGVIACWEDNRDSTAINLFAQRVDLHGDVVWNSNGIPVRKCVGSNIWSVSLRLTTDMRGGAIATWRDRKLADIGGPDQIYAARIGANGILVPIALESFTGEAIGEQAHLQWRTANESNNAGFEVQRFVAVDNGWVTIGYIGGNGTTTSSHQYQFIDNHSVYGENLYRLRQINTDGSSETSNVVSVLVGNVPSHPVLYPGFPDPFIDEVTLGYSLPDAMNIQLAVYDVLGREVLRLHDSWISAGYHQTTFGETLRRGTYLVKLQSPAEIRSIRITKR